MKKNRKRPPSQPKVGVDVGCDRSWAFLNESNRVKKNNKKNVESGAGARFFITL